MATRRAARGCRTCQDCDRPYERAASTDPRWCPRCVTGHIGRCSQCRAQFDLDGVHRMCSSCRDQAALFAPGAVGGPATIYVDDMRRLARIGSTRARWSHLFTDAVDSAPLHEFAERLGLRAEWVQHAGTHREHYDLTDTKRRAALALGAVTVSYPRGVAELLASKRTLTTVGGER